LNCSRKKFGPNFKELWNFLPKKLSLSSQKYVFGIRDPESRGQKGPNPGSRIRIRNTDRIHVFLSLPDLDPDPLVRGMDPDPDPALVLDPDPSINIQK
jgi:hypothetical protein